MVALVILFDADCCAAADATAAVAAAADCADDCADCCWDGAPNGGVERVDGTFTAWLRGVVCLWPFESIQTDVPHTYRVRNDEKQRYGKQID